MKYINKPKKTLLVLLCMVACDKGGETALPDSGKEIDIDTIRKNLQENAKHLLQLSEEQTHDFNQLCKETQECSYNPTELIKLQSRIEKAEFCFEGWNRDIDIVFSQIDTSIRDKKKRAMCNSKSVFYRQNLDANVNTLQRGDDKELDNNINKLNNDFYKIKYNLNELKIDIEKFVKKLKINKKLYINVYKDLTKMNNNFK